MWPYSVQLVGITINVSVKTFYTTVIILLKNSAIVHYLLCTHSLLHFLYFLELRLEFAIFISSSETSLVPKDNCQLYEISESVRCKILLGSLLILTDETHDWIELPKVKETRNDKLGCASGKLLV